MVTLIPLATVTGAEIGSGPNLSSQDKVCIMFNQEESPSSRPRDKDFNINVVYLIPGNEVEKEEERPAIKHVLPSSKLQLRGL